MKKLFLILLIAAVGVQADEGMNERSGHTHGNAGDPLRMFFREARVMAIDKVTQLKTCDFNKSDDEAKVKMLVGLKDKLAEDIEKSKHVWLSDFQGSCAFTQFDKSHSPVYLSYPECRDIMGDHDKAIELLIHESLHHLGIETETEADLLSQMIMNAEILEKCPDQAYDPFSETACEGSKIEKKDILSHFLPGKNYSKVVSQSDAASRYRRCNTLTGCGDWAKRTSAFEWFDANNNDKKDQVIAVNEFAKDFTYRIKTSNPTVFNVNLGASNLNCELSFQSNVGRFYCNPTYRKKVGRYMHSFYLRDPHTKVRSDLSSGNSSSKYTAKFNKTCFWVKNRSIGAKATNGDYLESEIVFFSRF